LRQGGSSTLSLEFGKDDSRRANKGDIRVTSHTATTVEGVVGAPAVQACQLKDLSLEISLGDESVERAQAKPLFVSFLVRPEERAR
jgi:hypothetical protein